MHSCGNATIFEQTFEAISPKMVELNPVRVSYFQNVLVMDYGFELEEYNMDDSHFDVSVDKVLREQLHYDNMRKSVWIGVA